MADRNTTWQEWEGTGDNRPPVYQEDERWVFRASAFGNCMKSLVAIGMGHDPMDAPEVIRRAWAEGHRNEPIILNLLKTREIGQKDTVTGDPALEEWRIWEPYDIEVRGLGVVSDGQLEVTMNVPGGAIVRGHTDGIGNVWKVKDDAGVTIPMGTVAVLEGKAFAESSWETFRRHGMEKFPYYAMQNSIYMHSTGLPLLFIIGVKDEEGVVQTIHTFFYTEPWYTIGQIKARSAKIRRLIGEGDISDPCEFEMYPCPVYYIHPDKSEVAAEIRAKADEIPDVGSLQLIGKRYAEVRAQEKEIKKVRDEGDKIIKAWIKDHPEMVGKEVEIPVGDGEAVVMTVTVDGVKEVVIPATDERIIEAKEAWSETIVHAAVPREVIPAEPERTETQGKPRVTIKTELVKSTSGTSTGKKD